MLALIIKPRLILVSHTDDLGWYITSHQQGKDVRQELLHSINNDLLKNKIRNNEKLNKKIVYIKNDIKFNETYIYNL